MKLFLRKLIIHFVLSIIFAFSTLIFTDFSILVFPGIGWGFLTIFYILIILTQILFYILTSYTKTWITLLSFILNFVLWVFEQVNLERYFQDSFFYQDNNFRYGVIVLGGLLWAINKLILDRIFIIFKVHASISNRIDWILNYKSSIRH